MKKQWNKAQPICICQYSRTPFERPPPLERPLYNVNLNLNVLNSTPDERPPFFKAIFLTEKGWPHKRGSTVYKKQWTPPIQIDSTTPIKILGLLGFDVSSHQRSDCACLLIAGKPNDFFFTRLRRWNATTRDMISHRVTLYRHRVNLLCREPMNYLFLRVRCGNRGIMRLCTPRASRLAQLRNSGSGLPLSQYEFWSVC